MMGALFLGSAIIPRSLLVMARMMMSNWCVVSMGDELKEKDQRADPVR